MANEVKSTETLATNDKFSFVSMDEQASEHIDAPVYSYWKSTFKTFFKNKVAIICLVIAVTTVLIAFIQPMISHYNPLDLPNIRNSAMKYLSPSAKYWFGTDHNGDSLFDVVWAGARTSFGIAIIVTFINTTLGTIIGAIWGYSKKFDTVMIEIYNIIANVPFILVVMVLSYILGQGVKQLIFAMTITGWLGQAYFIRTQVMMIRDREYNLASRCLGTPMKRMVTKNILPYLISVLVTMISREVPANVSYEVFLSYLNIGLTQATPSLGRTISTYSAYMAGYPYLFWIPVAVLALVSISLYVVGQALADASDPKTHM